MKKSKEKWHFILGRGMHPVVVMDLVYKGHTQSFGKVLNLPFNIYFTKRYEGATYFLGKEYRKIILYFAQKIKKKPNEVYKFPVFFEKKSRDLTNFSAFFVYRVKLIETSLLAFYTKAIH